MAKSFLGINIYRNEKIAANQKVGCHLLFSNLRIYPEWAAGRIF